jgi:hypothetical protein
MRQTLHSLSLSLITTVILIGLSSLSRPTLAQAYSKEDIAIKAAFGDADLQSLRKKMERIRSHDYSRKLPDSNFLSEVQFVKPGELCVDLWGGCNGKKNSYKEYLEFKLNLMDAGKELNSVQDSMNKYLNTIKNDRSSGGDEVSKDVNRMFDTYRSNVSTDLEKRGFKKVFGVDLALGDPGSVLIGGLQSSVNFLGSRIKFGIDLAPAVSEVYMLSLSKGAISPSDLLSNKDQVRGATSSKMSPKDLNKIVPLLSTMHGLIPEIFKEFLENKNDIRKIDLSGQALALSQVVKEFGEIDDLNLLVPSTIKSIAEIQKKMEHIKQLDESLKILTEYQALSSDDEFFIKTDRLSAVLDIAFESSSIIKDIMEVSKLSNSPAGKKFLERLGTWQTIATSTKKAAFDEGLNFLRDEELSRSYRQLQNHEQQMQVSVDRYQQYIDSASFLIGNYIDATNAPNNNNSAPASAFQNHLTATTSGTSSHIGSASYSFRIPNQPIQTESQSRNFASRGTRESIQRANEYTNGQIVKAPLDIGLTWNQDTKLDLDSHLVTPNGEHIYFSERGKLNEAPNAFLYRDSIPNGGLKGAEQTRITQFQDGQYRFYVYNYSDATGEEAARIAGPNGLSNSGATVKLYEGGAPLTDVPNNPAVFDLNNPNVQKVGSPYPGNSTFNVPANQPGNAWYVFRLDTRTGILTRVDRLGNAPDSRSVPSVR